MAEIHIIPVKQDEWMRQWRHKGWVLRHKNSKILKKRLKTRQNPLKMPIIGVEGVTGSNPVGPTILKSPEKTSLRPY